MTEILFNASGVPLLGMGSSFMLQTTGVPGLPSVSGSASGSVPGSAAGSASSGARLPVLLPSPDSPDQTSLTSYAVADWGAGNRFPDASDALISKVGVLSTGLKFIRNFTLGQGIYPVRVTGYDDRGTEQLEMVPDQGIRRFVNSRMVRRYLEKALRDYLKFGPAFVQLIPTADGSAMAGINTVNARYCRLSVANGSGVVEKCFVSGKWPDTPGEGEFHALDVLDEYDPFASLERFRIGGKVRGRSFMYVVRDSWSNNEYYSAPLWWSAYLAGWLDIAAMVPSFLRKAYENQISWKWHVQIPYAFWDKRFPREEFRDQQLRQQAIEQYLDAVEENLCAPENANKAIFTFFEINPSNGKTEEQWIIKPLENKLGNEQNLVTSAAANSEILFALMINPNVLGAGMPGGTYAGNQGGSNIREAFLVNIANAWVDRQNILDPLEAYLRFNGVPEDIELRFRNTILTTLDSGAGTSKTMS
jgi:hypothetical protein